MVKLLKPRIIQPSSTNGDSLQTVGGKTVWAAAAGNSGITVQDENGTIATGVTQLDFQGAGVSASAGTGEVIVTVPGSTGGGSGGSAVLASKVYNPTTDAVYTTTSTAMVDIDATNLVVSFTAPASGAVLVTLSGLANMNATGSITYWGLRDSVGLVADSSMEMYYNFASPSRQIGKAKVGGLTPGNTYTWKWAWMRASGTATLSLSVGKQTATSYGPALMIVEAA